MKLNIAACALSLGIMCAMTSCSLDSDNMSYTFYDDVAIKSVSFGTLTRTIHTIGKSGKDSTYTSTYTGSYYPLSIDQKTRTITCVDSLLFGTDLKKVFLNVSTVNSASPYITYNDSSYTYISSTDTIDLSEPRKISVISNDGMHRCNYTISVAAHKEEADSFTWSSVTAECAQFKAMNSIRAVSLNGKLFCLGNKMPEAVENFDATAATLFAIDVDAAFAPEELRSFAKGSQIAAGDNSVYVFSPAYTMTEEGNTVDKVPVLYCSKDEGATWTEVSSEGVNTVSALVAVCNGVVYAVDKAGRLIETADEGATWAESSVDDNASLFPSTNVSAMMETLKSNNEMKRLVVLGKDANASASGVASVWSRLYDTTTSYVEPWISQPWDSSNGYKLPALRSLSATAYGEYLLAIGDKENSLESTDYSQIYTSIDHGLTWKNNGCFRLPKGFSVPAESDAAIVADKNNTLWIICCGSGAVWRGRLHRMTWAENQKYFD